MKKAKLVIWDLDETFWRGTLSEGKVERIPQNIEIVKSLTDRGIINSIVSKNDFDKVEEVLKDWGIYDYFVFPKVSWNPKGEIVKSLLEEIKLRAENVLFVDDNQSNRAEVEYYNKGITCIHPDDLQEMLKSQAFEGKDDKEHSRLKQYHVMEQRSEAETKFSSNEDFLRSSHIKIKISSDCIAQEERIFELMQRTNQLNYTKIRSEKEEVHRLLLDETVETRYIEARDDFGEYGIVGFYALKDNSLLHFLFSCRTIGFGIENFLYARIGYPELKVEGDVATPISKESKVDWIEVIEAATEQKMSSEINKTQRILMVAGCDLEQACAYLESKYNIDKEFATVVDGHEIRTSDLCSLVNTITLDSETQKELCEHLPFMANGITFSSKIYKGDYDIVILSVVDDYIRGMYKRKDDTYYVGFGGVHDQEEMHKLYPAEEWDYLNAHFDYIGYEPENDFRHNLHFILNHIPKTTKILIINGTDVDVSSWIGKERIERNQRMNQVVDEVISAYSNAKLVDMRKIVSSVDDLTGRDNRHFNRNVYYTMAKVIADLCDNSFDITPPHNCQCQISNKEDNAEVEKSGRENKKMVIVYGNCHTSIIAKMLEASPEFIEKYYIYPTERIQNITDPKDLYDDCYSQCDVFIHQSIRLNNRYGEEYASERIIARLKPGCKVIAIPNVYHLPLCFFPQYYDAHELKNENVKNCTTFFFRDAIIDSHLKNVKELYKLYTHVNKDYNAPLLYNNDEIVSSFNLFVDKVRVREKDWDIKVSQFILDNYKQHQLFYDPNHPTNYFLKYVTSELLKLLVDNRTVDDICEIKETLENIEYPVCQSVIAALGLEWKESSIRRNSPGTKWIPFKMTLFWYTYQYFIFVWMARDYPKSVRVLSKILWYNNYFYFILFKAIRKLYRLYNS